MTEPLEDPISPMPWSYRDHPADTSMIVDATGDAVIYDEGRPNDSEARFIVMLVNAAHAAGLDPARVVSDPDYHRAIVKALLEVSR